MTHLTAPALAGATRPATPPVPRRSRGNARTRLEIALFAGPALLVFLAFVILPVALAAFYSLYNWNGLGPLERFIGIDNYVRALSDPVFLRAIGNNFTILGLSILIQGPLAIGVALLLNRRLRGRAIFRALIFVPYVLAEVIAGLAFKLILSPRGGINAFLENVGLGDLAQPWLANPDIALGVMFVILTWKYLGFAILLMLAGLQGVPQELHEAAAIDGASWWQIQWRITLPLIAPTIRIWIFLSMIGSLQLFDMVWVTTKGGPVGATNTMAVYMLQNGQGAPGYGSAIAVILFVISLVVALVFQRTAMRRDLAGALTTEVAEMAVLDSAPVLPATRRRAFDWGQPWVYLVALVAAAVSVGPVLYVWVNGFRGTADINAAPGGWPNPWTVDNYVRVLTSERFWGSVLSSTLLAAGTTLGVVVLGVMAAFVIARYEFRGRGGLYALFAAGLMFPVTVAALPLSILLRNLDLHGTFLGVIIPQVGFALPTTIIILVPFLRAIPHELEEAAAIDGASRVGFFWRIMLPLAVPGLVTVGVLAFIASWNAYLLPLLILGAGGMPQDLWPLPLGVQQFSTQYSADTGAVLAYTSLSMIPALAFFLFAEKRIVGGLTGAVKG